MNITICSEDELKSYGFGMTGEQVNADRILLQNSQTLNVNLGVLD